MAIRIVEKIEVKKIRAPIESAAPAKKRRANGDAKQLITLRLDPEVIDKFKSTGPGWQARINEALRAAKV